MSITSFPFFWIWLAGWCWLLAADWLAGLQPGALSTACQPPHWADEQLAGAAASVMMRVWGAWVCSQLLHQLPVNRPGLLTSSCRLP